MYLDGRSGPSENANAPQSRPDNSRQRSRRRCLAQPRHPIRVAAAARSLKHNDTFIVLDTHGDMGAAPGGTDGLFHRDTRFLARLQLLLNDTPPLLLGSNLRDDNAALAVDLTNADVISDRHIVVEKDTVHILRTTFLWRDTAYQRFGVRNYGDRPVEIRLSILFANDFADLFEVRGTRRERRGTATAQLRGRDQVLLTYLGLDNKLRHTMLTFDPPPDRLATNSAVYVLRLGPREMRPIFFAAGCNEVEIAAGTVPWRADRVAPRAPRGDARAHQRRDVERVVQRDALPVGRRS